MDDWFDAAAGVLATIVIGVMAVALTVSIVVVVLFIGALGVQAVGIADFGIDLSSSNDHHHRQAQAQPVTPRCDPNYSGCVPDRGYDVNCPQVGHPVRVIGTDVDGLDADNDGIGCEY